MARIKSLHINGRTYAIDAEAETPLLTVLRDDLGLTGTKYGCGEGQCGACTVLVGGFPRRSCQTPVGAAAKRPIATIEGLAQKGKLHPLQQAFLDEQAFQCAYCTSGMIMTAVGFLRSGLHADEATIRRFMQGNICRCGTHPRIVAAIQRASGAMKKGQA